MISQTISHLDSTVEFIHNILPSIWCHQPQCRHFRIDH